MVLVFQYRAKVVARKFSRLVGLRRDEPKNFLSNERIMIMICQGKTRFSFRAGLLETRSRPVLKVLGSRK